jgi:hypothetical protein
MTKIVALYGRIGSGKTTLADALQSLRPDVVRWSFATPLRAAAIQVLLQARVVPDNDAARAHVTTLKDQPVAEGSITGRELLLGMARWLDALTPWWRERALEAEVAFSPASMLVIDDMRLPREFDAVKAMRGLTVRLHRLGDTPPANHLEGVLDDRVFDLDIPADATVDEAARLVLAMIDKKETTR